MTEAQPTGSCPLCRKPADPKFRPFCSKRCADLDLRKWLVEGYTVPAVELDDVLTDGSEE